MSEHFPACDVESKEAKTMKITANLLTDDCFMFQKPPQEVFRLSTNCMSKRASVRDGGKNRIQCKPKYQGLNEHLVVVVSLKNKKTRIKSSYHIHGRASQKYNQKRSYLHSSVEQGSWDFRNELELLKT